MRKSQTTRLSERCLANAHVSVKVVSKRVDEPDESPTQREELLGLWQADFVLALRTRARLEASHTDDEMLGSRQAEQARKRCAVRIHRFLRDDKSQRPRHLSLHQLPRMR